MQELLTFLESVDVGGQARYVWDWLHRVDVWLLGISVGVLIGLGHKMAACHRAVFLWGLRLAAVTLLVQIGAVAFQDGFAAVTEPARLTRCIVLAGLVLAVSWVSLPLLVFVYSYCQVGLAALLGYAGYVWFSGQSLEAGDLGARTSEALLVAGLAMIAAWLLHPLWDALRAHWPARRGSVSPKDAGVTLSRGDRRRLRRLVRWLARSDEARAGSRPPAAPVGDHSRLAAEYAWLLDQFSQRRPARQAGAGFEAAKTVKHLPAVVASDADAPSTAADVMPRPRQH